MGFVNYALALLTVNKILSLMGLPVLPL